MAIELWIAVGLGVALAIFIPLIAASKKAGAKSQRQSDSGDAGYSYMATDSGATRHKGGGVDDRPGQTDTDSRANPDHGGGDSGGSDSGGGDGGGGGGD